MNDVTPESLLELSESLRSNFRGAEAATTIAQIEERYADFLSAIDWFANEGRVDEARRLTAALAPFWMATKRLQEGAEQINKVLSFPGGDDSHRARALFNAGYLTFWKGEYDGSSAYQNEAIAVARRAKEPTVVALGLVGLARIALRTDVEEARRLCRQAIAETEGTEDVAGRSGAMHVLGVAAQMAGDFVEAREVMGRRIGLARGAGDLYTISSECGNLCMVERQLGNLDEAEELGREALEIDFRTGNEMAIPWKVNGLAAVAADRGEFERAATLIGIADVTLEAAGGAWPPDELAQYERTIGILDGALGAVGLARGRALARGMSTPQAVAFALGESSPGAS